MLLEGYINARQAVARTAARSPPSPGAPGRRALPTRTGLRSGLRYLRDRAELLHEAQKVRISPAFNACAMPALVVAALLGHQSPVQSRQLAIFLGGLADR